MTLATNPAANCVIAMSVGTPGATWAGPFLGVPPNPSLPLAGASFLIGSAYWFDPNSGKVVKFHAACDYAGLGAALGVLRQPLFAPLPMPSSSQQQQAAAAPQQQQQTVTTQVRACGARGWSWGRWRSRWPIARYSQPCALVPSGPQTAPHVDTTRCAPQPPTQAVTAPVLPQQAQQQLPKL